MRLYAFALVASTPILAHNTTFTRTSVSTMRDVNFAAGPRRSDRIHNDVHVNQSLAVRGYTNGEERTRYLLSFERKAKKAASLLLAKLHEHYPRLSQLPRLVLDHLLESDGNVIDHFTGLHPDFTVKRLANLIRARVSPYSNTYSVKAREVADNTIQFIRKTIQTRQQDRAQEMEEKQGEWLRDGFHPDEVFKKLSIATETYRRKLINPLASPDLEVLRQYIERYNKLFVDSQRKEITLVGTLYKGFGRELAHYLFVASHSPIFGLEAYEMHQALLMEWYRDGMTIDAAADKLGIATEKSKGTWIKYLYTFIEYSALLHREGRVKEGTTFSYLKTRLGDYFFSLLTVDARNLGTSYLSDWEKELFEIWKEVGVDPNNMYQKVVVRPRYLISKTDRQLEKVTRERFAAWSHENEFDQRTPVLHNFFSQ